MRLLEGIRALRAQLNGLERAAREIEAAVRPPASRRVAEAASAKRSGRPRRFDVLSRLTTEPKALGDIVGKDKTASVWSALHAGVKAGTVKKTGRGFYALADVK